MTERKRVRYGSPTPSRAQAAVPPAGAHRLTPLRGSVVVPSTYTPARGVPVVGATAPSVPPVVRAAPRAAPPPARPLRERVRARTGAVEVLVFRVGRERFGVELATVEEAIDLVSVHHVPEMPPAMLGVITVRGALTPVYSPLPSLGLPLADGACALLFRQGGVRFALVIDDVEDVLAIDLSHVRDAPGLDEGDGVLLGVVRTADSLLALVDADALLAICRFVPAPEPA